MIAKSILTKNVRQFKRLYDSESADGGLHLSLGKVLMATELGLISQGEMEEYIDLFFQEHKDVKNKYY